MEKMTTAIERALYRGRRVDNGKWAIGMLVSDPDCTEIYVYSEDQKSNISGWTCYDVDPSTVGQWTGLLTTDKQKIWSNSMLLSDVGFGGRDRSHVWYVKWDKTSGMYLVSDRYNMTSTAWCLVEKGCTIYTGEDPRKQHSCYNCAYSRLEDSFYNDCSKGMDHRNGPCNLYSSIHDG